MEVIELESAAAIAAVAADAIESLVRASPSAVLGVATGSTPLPTYRELHRRRAAGTAPSYEGVEVFALDEYVGLPEGDEQSYRTTIIRELTRDLGIAEERVHAPDPDPARLPSAGARYEEALERAGGVDLQILGIGTNGHIAFNEGASSLASITRVKTLTAQTRQDNARFFGSLDDVPLHVLTQGIGTIRRARHLVLIATGSAKAQAVAQMVEGPVSSMCPASALQLHPRVSVLLDGEAAAALRGRDYYREVWSAKPDWQGL